MTIPVNSKILLSLASIAAAGALVVGATFAFFTDQATSQDNTFSTGNADLQIALEGSESPGTYGNDIPAPAFSEVDIFPGFSNDYIFWLKNNSASDITLDLTATFDDVQILTGNATLADQLQVAFTCSSDTDSDGSLDTVVGSAGPFSVNAWDAGSGSLGTLGLNDGTPDGLGADEAECTMTVSLPTTADNTVANSGLRFDGVFNAAQTPPTP